MNKTWTFWMKTLAAAGILGCIAWEWVEPGFEPVITLLGCVSGFIALLIVERKKAKPQAMYQRGGRKSTNIQSHNSITINPKP